MLGILYESYVHPLILYSAASAGVEALLALELFNAPFSLASPDRDHAINSGIVKKRRMMVDFALEARNEAARPDAGTSHFRGPACYASVNNDDHAGGAVRRTAIGRYLAERFGYGSRWG